MFKIKIKKLDKEAFIPKFRATGSMVMLFKSPTQECVPPKQRIKIPLGLGIQFETMQGDIVYGGLELQIRPTRTNLDKGLTTPFGTVDAQYRGNINVVLHNNTNDRILIPKGCVIAEGIVNQIPIVTLEVTQDLSDSFRGDAGFGSTGGS